MAWRTTKDHVKDILTPGHDYDTIENPILDPFLTAANKLVNVVVTWPTPPTGLSLDDGVGSTAVEVEAWLAAGIYKMSDQQLKSSQAGRSSGQFRGESGKRSESNKYMEQACMLDYSRVLAPLLDGRIAGATWLGKLLSEQIPYSERDGG